jgi:hypothetical protein
MAHRPVVPPFFVVVGQVLLLLQLMPSMCCGKVKGFLGGRIQD